MTTVVHLISATSLDSLKVPKNLKTVTRLPLFELEDIEEKRALEAVEDDAVTTKNPVVSDWTSI